MNKFEACYLNAQRSGGVEIEIVPVGHSAAPSRVDIEMMAAELSSSTGSFPFRTDDGREYRITISDDDGYCDDWDIDGAMSSVAEDNDDFQVASSLAAVGLGL